MSELVLDGPPQWTGTSSGGIERRSLPKRSVIAFVGALGFPHTSAEETHGWRGALWSLVGESTDSGHVTPALAEQEQTRRREETRRAVSELRLLSGLTWEQLAQLFGVSRRSVHFWVSGQPLSERNERRVHALLDLIRKVNRGDVHSTRAALLQVHDGRSAFELLVDGQLAEASALLGPGPGRPRRVLGELSPEAKAARRPPPPEELVEALQDRVHKEVGRARAAQTVRTPRRGGS